jgi:hypothetical protein
MCPLSLDKYVSINCVNALSLEVFVTTTPDAQQKGTKLDRVHEHSVLLAKPIPILLLPSFSGFRLHKPEDDKRFERSVDTEELR